MADKRYQDEEWLREQYWGMNRSLSDIASECGVCTTTIHTWMDKLGVDARSCSEGTELRYDDQCGDRKYQDGGWLEEQYVDRQQSTCQIADRCGVSTPTILRHLKENGIETRGISEGRALAHSRDKAGRKYRDREWLQEQYITERRSASDIGQECNVSQPTILEWLHKFDIPVRSYRETTLMRNGHDEVQDSEWLAKEYHDQGKTTIEIAESVGCSVSTVIKWMQRHGIEFRTLSECDYPRGENHGSWKGGSPTYYGENWSEKRQEAIERDGSRCQICGISRDGHRDKFGQDIDVHHVRPIRTFDQLEDANVLDNLITLCRECHRVAERYAPLLPDYRKRDGASPCPEPSD